jgi:hypothetical protein
VTAIVVVWRGVPAYRVIGEFISCNTEVAVIAVTHEGRRVHRMFDLASGNEIGERAESWSIAPQELEALQKIMAPKKAQAQAQASQVHKDAPKKRSNRRRAKGG